jgi:hypothetical protein
MIEINLLPWREHQRLRQLQRKGMLCGLVMTVLLAGAGCFRYWQSRNVSVPAAIPVIDQWQSDLQQVRFVGFLHQQKRIWALILLPDGKTVDVQVGSIVMDGGRVTAINEKNVVFGLPNHQVFALSFVGTGMIK